MHIVLLETFVIIIKAYLEGDMEARLPDGLNTYLRKTLYYMLQS